MENLNTKGVFLLNNIYNDNYDTLIVFRWPSWSRPWLHCTALVANIQKSSPRVLSNEDDHKPSEHPHTLGGCGTLSLSLAIIKFYTYPAIGLVFVSVTKHLATFIKYSSVRSYFKRLIKGSFECTRKTR